MGFLDQLLGGRKKKTKKSLALRQAISAQAPEFSMTFVFEWMSADGVELVRALPLTRVEMEASSRRRRPSRRRQKTAI